MSSSKKTFDLRKNYILLCELGMIAALLIFIGAFKFHLPVSETNSSHFIVEDEPPIVLSPITKQEKPPAAPPLARIPVEVPNDEPIEVPDIEFPEFGDSEAALSLPPEEPKDEKPEILEQVQFMPELKGGIKALYSDITYPELAKRNGVEGTVEVRFIVNEKGEVEDPEIIRGIGAGCDEEVLEAIKLQSYTPGIQNGRLVKVRMRQLVHFRLN
ncbi:TonB family protein [Gracilimonas sp.]|uniref:energy transducer TonB n=1 Tax=Gracilimonas sp. TaxID=1974203 RepID=UPI003BA8C2FB